MINNKSLNINGNSISTSFDVNNARNTEVVCKPLVSGDLMIEIVKAVNEKRYVNSDTVNAINKCVEYFTKIDKEGRRQHTISAYKNLVMQYNGLVEGRENRDSRNNKDNRKISIIYKNIIVYPTGYNISENNLTKTDLIILKRLLKIVIDINKRVLGIDYETRKKEEFYDPDNIKMYLSKQLSGLRLKSHDFHSGEKLYYYSEKINKSLSNKSK